jgi:hypothetical protein
MPDVNGVKVAPRDGAEACERAERPSRAEPSVQISDSLSPAREQELPGLRLWFLIYLAWLAGLAALAHVGSVQLELGSPGAMGLWTLSLMAFYLSLCNLFLPLPTAWIILLAASPDGGAFGSAWQRVAAVTVVGAAATAIANVNEYHVLSYVLGHGLGGKLRRTRVYEWAVRWFDAAPFQVLALIGFVPVPIDAVRWLAILRRYRVAFRPGLFRRRACATFVRGFSRLASLCGKEISRFRRASCGRVAALSPGRGTGGRSRSPGNAPGDVCARLRFGSDVRARIRGAPRGSGLRGGEVPAALRGGTPRLVQLGARRFIRFCIHARLNRRVGFAGPTTSGAWS